MYSHSLCEYNTVFLITFLGCFLYAYHCFLCVFTVFSINPFYLLLAQSGEIGY